MESRGSDIAGTTGSNVQRVRAGLAYYGVIAAWYVGLAAVMTSVGRFLPVLLAVGAVILVLAAAEVVVVMTAEGVEDWWDNFRAEKTLVVLGSVGNVAAIVGGTLLGAHLR